MAGNRLPQKLPFSKKKLPLKVILSYIFDYVILIILLLLIGLLDHLEPFHQNFSLRNYTIQYPFAVHERVPNGLLYFVGIGCPLIIICIYTLIIDGFFSHKHASSAKRGIASRFGTYKIKQRLWELNCGALGLFLAVLGSNTVVAALKNATGKPRPDLIDRCQPVPNVTDPPVYGLSDSSICMQLDKYKLKDGFRSFPSGHSSTAFAGLIYLSLYLAGKLHIRDTRGEVWKFVVILLPFIGACLVADSRIMDARHHPFDVITGSLLGLLGAWISYRQYFPPLSEPWRKGRAYPIRSWGTEALAPPGTGEGVEPLRTDNARGVRSGDEEQEVGVWTSGTVRRTAPSDLEAGNVFRQQISDSHRQRREEGHSRGAESTNTIDIHPTNPFVRPQQRRRNSDDYWSSSSSSEEENDHEFELQPSYTLNDPQGTHQTGYNREENFANTAYHSQIGHTPQVSVSQGAGNHQSMTGGLGRSESLSPGREIGSSLQGTKEEHDPHRGVDLVETYAR
ncbi:MAG: hypothetical protein M1812_006557 [Candelaria pacifica]|nr:MAG: hypothetical protein M1812_006557 [Candelaria pacifica]